MIRSHTIHPNALSKTALLFIQAGYEVTNYPKWSFGKFRITMKSWLNKALIAFRTFRPDKLEQVKNGKDWVVPSTQLLLNHAILYKSFSRSYVHRNNASKFFTGYEN